MDQGKEEPSGAKNELPAKLKPFRFHGVDFTTFRGGQGVAD